MKQRQKQIIYRRGVTAAKYTRSRHLNRQTLDIARQMLNFLAINGPSAITQLSYNSEINSVQKNKVFEYLQKHNLVQVRDIADFLPRKGRHPISRINRMHPSVKAVIIMTPLGHKYLEKINALEQMIRWEK